jgi:hypothetical protein
MADVVVPGPGDYERRSRRIATRNDVAMAAAMQ